MARPFVRTVLVAAVMSGVMATGLGPADASEGEPPYEYSWCYDIGVLGEPDKVSVCFPRV